MLDIRVKLLRSPWEHSIPSSQLRMILTKLTGLRASDIESCFDTGEYQNEDGSPASFAIVVMDPTCPPSVPSTEAVLAIIEIGERGSELVVNGLDKVCELRDFGVNGGQLLFGGASYVIRDGGFRWGHAAQIGFLQGGGSGLNQLQDRYQTTLFLAELELELCEAREEWERTHPRVEFSWFCEENTPSPAYNAVLARKPII